MNLLSPKSIIVKKDGPFQTSFEISKKQSYTIAENGVEIKKHIETVYKSKPAGKYQAKVDVPPLKDETIELYHSFQSLINHCNNNAEVLNNQLRDFVLTIKDLNQTKEEIMAKDFMSLRDILSDFLKTNTIIKAQDLFNTREKIKAITSTFHRYISDRNIYTHGILKLRFPEKVFVMQYIENKRITVYAELSIEILKSNLSVSEELANILAQINTIYNDIKKLI